MISLPCEVTVHMYLECGFPFRTSKFELRNATNGELIFTDKEKIFDPPTSYKDYIILNNARIGKGSYSLSAIINGVTHPSVNFTVVNSTCAI